MPRSTAAAVSRQQERDPADRMGVQTLQDVPHPLQSGSHEFPNARAGMASPLAKRLFAVDGVTAVFFGNEFITITKQVHRRAARKSSTLIRKSLPCRA